jgi:hypothetical protein
MKPMEMRRESFRGQPILAADRESFRFSWPHLMLGMATGAMLTASGVLAIGEAGDGSGALLFIYSSPSGLLPIGLLPLVTSVVLWTVGGLLVGAAKSSKARRALLALLMLHYAGISIVLMCHPQELEWDRFAATAGRGELLILCGGVVVYVAAQMYAWSVLLSARR